MKNDLHALLQEWNPPLPHPADIRRGVWRRLEAQEQPVALPWALKLAMALVFIGVALGTGLQLGTSASEASLTRAYLSSVNPYSHFQ